MIALYGYLYLQCYVELILTDALKGSAKQTPPKHHPWPSNSRDLGNVIQDAIPLDCWHRARHLKHPIGVIPGFNRQPMSHYSSHSMSGYFETGYKYQFANTYELKPSGAVEFGILTSNGYGEFAISKQHRL